MKEFELEMMRGMVSILNDASEAYYNTDSPMMSDEQFDAMLEDLKQLEEETGIIMSNSPTINVGAKVLTELEEVEHNHPMLSLEKCHTTDELVKFSNGKELVSSIKLDGLTVSLLYEDGVLVSAETRGNGYVGSDVTEHIKRFKNVPLKINKGGTYIIDGEAIITDEDFAEVNKDGEYKNSRNLASGTLSVLDTSLVAKRKLSFFAWDVIEGGGNSLKDNLDEAKELGFEVVPFWFNSNIAGLDENILQSSIDYMFDYAKQDGYPCDGIVFKFNDVEYGKSLGATSHHFRNGIAYKKKDEAHTTKLIDIDWTMGRTNVLTPTAVFEPVEIDGTIVERASVHNVSILTKLDLHIGDTIEIVKANQIIPQVKRNVSSDERNALGKEPDYIAMPSTCPICNGDTTLVKENDSMVLICTNDNCKGKLLGKLTHFVSKNAMNVDGLSESTIDKFMEVGWINNFTDIYNLDYYYNDIVNLDGFGKKSADKLMSAIEKSKDTTLDRFIYSLSIPLIGRSASKDIAKYYGGDFNKFFDAHENGYVRYEDALDGFGDKMSKSINEYMTNDIVGDNIVYRLAQYMNFEIETNVNSSADLSGLVFVITGSLNQFVNRDEAKDMIEKSGGKVSGSVSKKTSYLVNNDVASTSGKNKKAIEIGVPIINEQELIKMLK